MIPSDTRPERIDLPGGLSIARCEADDDFWLCEGSDPVLYLGEHTAKQFATALAPPPADGDVANPWVDTRLVRFDDTILFGHGGFDFDAWDGLRWEMHIPGAASYAVWPNGGHGKSERWSFYGGPDGMMALERYSCEAHARADAEAYALSIKTASDMRVAARDTEIATLARETERLRKLVEVSAELRAMSDAATKGDWRVETNTTLVWGDCVVEEDGSVSHLGVPVVDAQQARAWSKTGQPNADTAKANAAFSAAAVNFVRFLAATTDSTTERGEAEHG